MSKDWYQDIVDFHSEVMLDDFPTNPYIPNIKRQTLRETLIKEEVGETLAALASNDLVELADGICDSIVVLLGTAVTYGIDIRPVWDEVHRTNMAKADGALSSVGKRLKPKGWESPKVKSILIEQGAELWARPSL